VTYVFPLLIILAANDFFYLIDYSGPGDSQDLGIPIILIGLIYHVFIKRSDIRPLNNFFTWYIFFYLLLVLSQVSVAAFNYSQSIMDGIFAGRKQIYYLAFPIFLLALNEPNKARNFMKALSMLAFILILLSFVHYGLCITVFQGRFATEGSGLSERGGMVRVMLPGMNIVIIGLLWQFWSYLRENRLLSVNLAMFLVTTGGLMARLTRGRIIAVSAVLLLMMVSRKRYGMLAAVAAIVLMVVVANLMFGSAENPIVYAFTSAISDVTETEGTWSGRVQQVIAAWDAFVSSFATGTGGMVIGSDLKAESSLLEAIAFEADLGYWVFIKFFGYWGILFLGGMIGGFYWYVLRCGKLGSADDMAQFAIYHFICILISMITITYLTKAGGIVMVCLTWALIVQSAQMAMAERSSKKTVSAESMDMASGSKTLGIADIEDRDRLY